MLLKRKPGLFVIADKSSQLPIFQEAINGVQDIHWLQLNDWLAAGVYSRLPTEYSFERDPDGLTIFIDGYISDYVGEKFTRLDFKRPAKVISKIYRAFGTGFLRNLRGSYSCLIFDPNKNLAYVFNDRCASRPLFYSQSEDRVLRITPEITSLSAMDKKSRNLSLAGIGAFLIRGYSYGNHTLFEGVSSLPYASLLTLGRDEIKFDRYWRLHYHIRDDNADEKQLVEEANVLLVQATRRLVRNFDKPIISLSGGIDSRIVLSYLLDELGPTIPALSYGTAHPATGNDLDIARRLAKQFRLNMHELEVTLQDFTSTAHYAMQQIDGRVDIIDAPGLVKAWESLDSALDVCFNGDQCFGWKGQVTNEQEALNKISRWGLEAVPRIRDWLYPSKINELESAVESVRNQIVREAAQKDIDGLKDTLVYNESLGNVLNSFTARRLRIIESARPLLDEDVMEFVAGLPPELRWNKRLLLGIFQRCRGLNAVPLATSSALFPPKIFVKTVRETPAIKDFFWCHLVDSMDDRLSALFDVEKLRIALRALFDGQPLPAVRENWYQYLPIISWFGPQREGLVHPLITMRRLLAINLYLDGLNKE